MTWYQFVTTADQSPSLRLESSTNPHGENMHAIEGAFSETQYIYGECIEANIQEYLSANLELEQKPVLHFLSIGLGMAYVELAIVCKLLVHNIDLSVANIKIHSYEQVDLLRVYFKEFIFTANAKSNQTTKTTTNTRDTARAISYDMTTNKNDDKKDDEKHSQKSKQTNQIPADFLQSYKKIFDMYAQHYKLSQEQIFKAFQYLFDQQKLELRGEFLAEKSSSDTYSCILYDAFSAKTNPELWEQNNLQSILQNHSKEKSFFSTYAAAGALKRALKASHYELKMKSGFGKKRESTFAVRNLNANSQIQNLTKSSESKQNAESY